MKKLNTAALLALILAFCASLSAQVLTTPLVQVTDPTGNCTVQTQQIVVNTANQKLWICNSVTGAYTSSSATGSTTGTGAAVLANTPTLITPVLGVATATSINGNSVPTATDTVALLAATQTFTNKTLTSPTLTTPVIATITNTGTITLPTNTGGVPVLYSCGATTGAATCANTSGGATARVITGLATLASNSAVISGISPAFTSTSTFSCTSNDQTTIGNPTKVLNTSASSITISDTTGASDVVAYSCVGY